MKNGYQIIVRTHLSNRLVSRLGTIDFYHLPTGDTLLITPPLDQAGLHGVFNRCRDLGITLLAVNALPMHKDPDDNRLR